MADQRKRKLQERKKPTHYTHAEWLAEAERRFGPDSKLWAFECPVCHGVQTAADFLALPEEERPKEIANVVNFSCIGRWLPNAPAAFSVGKQAKRHPTPETHCNYTLGGLFTLPGAVVEFEGREVSSFAFATVQAEAMNHG